VAGKDAIEQIPADRNFCKLEGDSTGVADYPCADFNQPRL
jgi:hypothetical protein